MFTAVNLFVKSITTNELRSRNQCNCFLLDLFKFSCYKRENDFQLKGLSECNNHSCVEVWPDLLLLNTSYVLYNILKATTVQHITNQTSSGLV